ncbi:hypothetical protein ABMA28_002356 [Loxostege sticticalis]|uniref:Uncharacterized protein n=1 Tax=Loxostege sticticalis TaxID=481309 RepID=A0ABD0T0T3_LOXSC
MAPNASDTLLPEVMPKDPEKALSVQSLNGDQTECDCHELNYGAWDAVLSTFVVAPLVVSVWRGTWGLMDLHSPYFPYAEIFLLGIVIHTSFALVRSLLLSRSVGAWSEDHGAGRWLRERVLSRFYTYVFILSNIMHWRGGWGLLDATVAAILPDERDPHRPVLIAAFTILFYMCAVSLRSSRNLLASPYFLVTDGKEATYIFTTRFKDTVSTS